MKLLDVSGRHCLNFAEKLLGKEDFDVAEEGIDFEEEEIVVEKAEIDVAEELLDVGRLNLELEN